MIPRAVLLSVAATLLSGCGHTVRHDEIVRFRDVAAETGLRFHHMNGATGEFYLPEIMGSGVGLLDYDRDGDLDVFLVQGATLASGKLLFPPPSNWKPGHRLFRNELVETGKLSFTDTTEAAGLKAINYGMGVAVADYDNDGYPDLFVTGFGATILYHNKGNGSFADVTREAGVTDSRWSTSASFFDYDRDGLQDLFVLHYVDFTTSGNKVCQAATGERDYCTPKAYHGVPAQLFHNLGNGKFRDVSEAAGISSAYGPGLGVAAADLNADGWPDLYVTNDTARNLLWINRGKGAFTEAGLESGAAYAFDGIARAGMGVSVEDFDADGNPDLLVTNLMREGVTLFHSDGRGNFEDLTTRFGLARLTVPFTGFGTGWFDFDNDGRLDLFIANGAVTIMENQRGKPYPFEQRNLLLHNEGTSFRDITEDAGSALNVTGVGRGAAFGDIDNDGDIDIVVSNNNGPVRLLLNESRAGHWLGLQLDGGPANRSAMGASATLIRNGKSNLLRRVHTDGSYLSASDSRMHFGLGADTRVDAVVVEWPGGVKERWENLPVDRIVHLNRGSGTIPR